MRCDFVRHVRYCWVAFSDPSLMCTSVTATAILCIFCHLFMLCGLFPGKFSNEAVARMMAVCHFVN